MSTFKGLFVTTFVLSVVFSVGCDDGQVSSSPPITDEIPKRFQPLATAIEAERVSSGTPGVAVAIVEKGEVTFAHGFGTKDPTGTAPVKPTTLFRVGSITKVMTAIALLQTVQAGMVDLQAPVTKYLPTFHLNRTPTPAATMTVQHLLTHTSGLFDYLEINAPTNEMTDDGLAGFLTGRFADVGYVQSPPGAFYAYANPGYMLAGLIAETVTGTAYRTRMHDQVFKPLGMNRTMFLAEDVVADGDYANAKTCGADDAGCSMPAFGPVVRPDSYDNPWARPAGYAWSSVLDLAKLMRFLLRGQANVLSEDLRIAMTSPQASMPESAGFTSYGYGTVINRMIGLPALGSSLFYDLKMLWHDGGIPGYSSFFACLPEPDVCFVTLANGDGAYFQNSLVTAIRTLVDLPSPIARPDVAPRVDRYPNYAGTYTDPFAIGDVQVTTDNGKLWMRLPTQEPSGPAYELQPSVVDNFVATIDGTPTPIAFIADETGTYRYIYSRPVVATRAATPTSQ